MCCQVLIVWAALHSPDLLLLEVGIESGQGVLLYNNKTVQFISQIKPLGQVKVWCSPVWFTLCHDVNLMLVVSGVTAHSQNQSIISGKTIYHFFSTLMKENINISILGNFSCITPCSPFCIGWLKSLVYIFSTHAKTEVLRLYSPGSQTWWWRAGPVWVTTGPRRSGTPGRTCVQRHMVSDCSDFPLCRLNMSCCVG